MTYKQVNNNMEVWKSLPDRDMNSQVFYPIQKGKGITSSIYLPPMQGIIEKAKIKIRKQIKKKSPKKKPQSKGVKKRGRTTTKKPLKSKKKSTPKKKRRPTKK